MPMGIVDGFEMVDIEHGEGQRCAGAACSLDLRSQHFLGCCMVIKAGHGIANHEIAKFTKPRDPGSNGGHQVFGIDRFSEEIVAAFIHRVHLNIGVGFTREKNDGKARIFGLLPDDGGDFLAAALGHPQIDQNQFR